jgi:glycogen operon protein
LWFERHGAGFAPPAAYPRKAAACASTHDLPTLAGWWNGADIAEKAALGLISPEAAEADHQRRGDDKARLIEALARENLIPPEAEADLPFDPALVAAIHAFLAKTRAALAMVQIDDVFGETVSVNLPGTDRERPNWRRKLAREATADSLRAAALRS